MAQRIATGHSVTIVALGSSSTAGAGASAPAASYPSRLEVELKASFPKQAITVLNRGVNGEEAAEMMARFDDSVAAAHPDVVLWQVGTNAVLRDNPLGPVDRLVHDGIARIKAIGADVVLIDPQFAPKVTVKPDAEEMVNLISAAAKQASVDLFPRFAADAGVARPGCHSVRGVPVARPASYERLELWLSRQASVLGDGRGGDAAGRFGPGRLSGRPGGNAGQASGVRDFAVLILALAEKLQQHREHVDEVEIERQRADDRRSAVRWRRPSRSRCTRS